MIGSKQDTARMQSDFYRDKYRKMLRTLLVSVVIMMMLIFGIIYLVLFRASPQYYATTMEGQIIAMQQIKS